VILGVASVWSQRKGLLDFIKLSEKIEERAKIILIGLNNNQIKNLPKNIIGIKRTESIEELACFYSLADLFVNPTWEDNFPTTNLEAMSCGTPVLTYKTGGSVESINYETGFIVDKGDISGIVDAIEDVRQKGKNHYSNNCIKHIKEKFNKKLRYKIYLNVYNQLINRRKLF
jgi:putative colanic acid biosynthesis glycosyltransferase